MIRIHPPAVLSAREAEFLARLAADGQTLFSTAEAQAWWGDAGYTANVLSRLVDKGWLQRLERGVYMLIPLEAGPERAWSESALVIAPHLIQLGAYDNKRRGGKPRRLSLDVSLQNSICMI